jgi:hypothetical protein
MKLNIDYVLLAEQIRTIGDLLDKLNSNGTRGQTEQERTQSAHLLGVWNLLRKLQDDRTF